MALSKYSDYTVAWVLLRNIFAGVADFGYDLYFLVIAELLNHKYLGLLNFYFHTLIQQRLFAEHSEGKSDSATQQPLMNFASGWDGLNKGYVLIIEI
ncbi:MAG: hypothetical protein QNJ68_01415 [Microcoleaceae cyanobacterium MO_207.B10]|nr:hypothetical protein [Microcoleaceae cyanobacterium MO_207.B10]